jgi:glutamate N-acetyltransferase / amino-acid N-acetyltransferase
MMSAPKLRDLPKQFTFAADWCGLKRKGLDLAVIVSEAACVAGAMFTTNIVKAAPVVLSRQHIKRSGGRIRAIIVNSKNANCATGKAGLLASTKTAAEVARVLQCPPEQVFVCSTGVIGVPLQVEKILHAVPVLLRSRKASLQAFNSVTRAIMTTDTRPKWAAEQLQIGGKTVRIIGCTKGAGMIQPNMATTLAFVVTDAAISHRYLTSALRTAVENTYNAITVDGDTSTNDTIAVLANGASGAPTIQPGGKNYSAFAEALKKVCQNLALQIVADGEGAQRVIEIEVTGARNTRAAKTIARTIANSPLVKTAFAGGDPNWGRIIAAGGRAGVAFDPAKVNIDLAGVEVCRNGIERAFNERAVHRKMLAKFVPVRLDLRDGNASARIWTCDFTGEYVRINASYRT